MTWFKIDDKFWCHPKVIRCSDSAVTLWVKAGTYCAQFETDGFFPAHALPLVTQLSTAPQELVDVGLWKTLTDPDGWQFHDWTEYQPDSATLEERRARERSRQREWRQTRGTSQRDIRRDTPRDYLGPDPTRTKDPPTPRLTALTGDAGPARKAVEELAAAWKLPDVTADDIWTLCMGRNPADPWAAYLEVKAIGRTVDLHAPTIRSPLSLLRSRLNAVAI